MNNKRTSITILIMVIFMLANFATTNSAIAGAGTTLTISDKILKTETTPTSSSKKGKMMEKLLNTKTGKWFVAKIQKNEEKRYLKLANKLAIAEKAGDVKKVADIKKKMQTKRKFSTILILCLIFGGIGLFFLGFSNNATDTGYILMSVSGIIVGVGIMMFFSNIGILKYAGGRNTRIF